jgi:capsular polysaccharide biosynthesis protein
VTWNDVNAIVLRVLRRWWIIVSVLVIVVGASFWGLSDSLDRYETTTLMVVGPNTEMEASEVLRVADLVGRNVVMATYADVMSSPKVVAAGMVAADPMRSDWADYEVKVVQEPDSNVLRMIVRGSDQTMTAELTAHVQSEGRATLAELFPIYSITSLDAGEPQAYLISLPWARTIGISVMIGLGLGVLLALWLDSLLAFRRTAYASEGRSGVAAPAAVVDPQAAAFTRR